MALPGHLLAFRNSWRDHYPLFYASQCNIGRSLWCHLRCIRCPRNFLCRQPTCTRCLWKWCDWTVGLLARIEPDLGLLHAWHWYPGSYRGTCRRNGAGTNFHAPPETEKKGFLIAEPSNRARKAFCYTSCLLEGSVHC